MYVAVKGGEQAIENAHELLDEVRRGDQAIDELSVSQIESQLSLAVARVMSEGSLYDTRLAAIAIKQARGDLIEAIFLVRAYRTTLPRFGYTKPLDTSKMTIHRRISATFKDLPGGQILGPTFDYTHRLIDFSLDDDEAPRQKAKEAENGLSSMPKVLDLLNNEGLIESGEEMIAAQETPTENEPQQVGDITRDPLKFPASRDVRLQNLARGDEGFLLSLAYSTQRGYGRNHAFAGELRIGDVHVSFTPEELGFEIEIATITVSECETVNQFLGSKTTAPKFTRGYGLVFGQAERKAISMAVTDRALRARELGEPIASPAQDEEFVLSHSDNIQSTGFLEHLKLPHYVDFQSELELVRKMRREFSEKVEAIDEESSAND